MKWGFCLRTHGLEWLHWAEVFGFSSPATGMLVVNNIIRRGETLIALSFLFFSLELLIFSLTRFLFCSLPFTGNWVKYYSAVGCALLSRITHHHKGGTILVPELLTNTRVATDKKHLKRFKTDLICFEFNLQYYFTIIYNLQLFTMPFQTRTHEKLSDSAFQLSHPAMTSITFSSIENIF